MVDPALLEQASRLSVDERRELIHAIEDTIEADERPVSPEVAALIRERVAEARANPFDGRPWEDVWRDLNARPAR